MKTNKKEMIMKNNDLSELVAKAKAGDQEAFSELYNQTSAELYRSIRAMTRDEDLAWDIQQDAYLNAYQKLDTLENNEAFLPWLRRIAVNATVSRMRQRRPMTFTDLAGDDEDTVPELPDLSPESQPELALDRKETTRLVQEILSKLPEEQQLIVGMRYYDELSVKEIAETLNISVGAVKAQLFHGRKKVETAVRALEKQGVKLYGLSPLPFLIALLRRMEPAEAARQTAVKTVVAKAGLTAGAKTAALAAGTTGAAAEVAEVAVLHATRPFFTTVLGKVVLGVICAGVVVGGAAGYRWAKNSLFEKSNPIPYADTDENLRTNPTAPTLPVEIVTTGEVGLDPTEPEETVELTEPTKPEKPTEPAPSETAANTEAERDNASVANIQTAYKEARQAHQLKANSGNATYFALPGEYSLLSDTEDYAVVAVKNVQILSEEANAWSAQGGQSIPINPGDPWSYREIPEDPGIPGDYMMIFILDSTDCPEIILDASNDVDAFAAAYPEWFAERVEGSRDATSMANLRSAYAQAMVAVLTNESHDNTVLEYDSDGNAVITAKHVTIESQKANDWSGMNIDSPFDALLPADPGVPGEYTVVFFYTGDEVTKVEFAGYYDPHAFDAQNSAPEELSREAEDMGNLRNACANIQVAAVMQDDYYYFHGITREGDAPGSYVYRATVEATQTIPGWHSSSMTGLGDFSPEEIPARVQGESWTIVYDEATQKYTIE